MSDSNARGMVHVLTGPGKGKTTAAFGLAMRAAGHGLAVCIVQLMKTGETTGEVIAARRLGSVSVTQFGTGRFIGPDGPAPEDIALAKEGLRFARAVLEGGKCSLLVLDEVNTAVRFGLLSTDEVLTLLTARGPTEVVLTGRDAPKELVDAADYVSFIDNLKHPYEKGNTARKGIEW